MTGIDLGTEELPDAAPNSSVPELLTCRPVGGSIWDLLKLVYFLRLREE